MLQLPAMNVYKQPTAAALKPASAHGDSVKSTVGDCMHMACIIIAIPNPNLNR